MSFRILTANFGHGISPRLTVRGSGYFVEYLLDRPDVKAVWETFVYHPFVMALGNGTLPLESFKGYIIQDYLYLVRPSHSRAATVLPADPSSFAQIHFARANALAAYKAKNVDDISKVNISWTPTRV